MDVVIYGSSRYGFVGLDQKNIDSNTSHSHPDLYPYSPVIDHTKQIGESITTNRVMQINLFATVISNDVMQK